MIAVDSPPKQVFIYPAQVPQTPLPLVEKIPGTTPGLLHSIFIYSRLLECLFKGAINDSDFVVRRRTVAARQVGGVLSHFLGHGGEF